MAILWCGGEDLDFPKSTAVTVVTNTANFRTGLARCAIYVRSTTVGTYAASNPFPGGAITSCWFSAYLYNASSAISAICFGLGQAGQAGRGLWVGTAPSTPFGTLSLYTYNGTTLTALATSSISIPVGSGAKVDVQVVNYGSSATVILYIGGALAITYSGGISVTGVSAFDSVLLGWSSSNLFMSELIVADADTRSLSLVTMAPNGNGTTQSWTNPAYTNFNPTTINDANTTYVNTTAQDEQAALIDTPTGSFSVLGIKIAARAMATSGATPTGVKLGVNSGGAVAVGSAHTLTTAFATYEDYLTNDPTTSAPFSQSSLNALQLDLRSA